jgi:glycosyl transferase family 25
LTGDCNVILPENETDLTRPLTIKVINLEKDAARRQAVTENLKDFNGGNWSFFKALGSDSPCSHVPDPAGQLIRYGRELGPGEIGCFKSHVAVMQAFIADPDAEWLLVLEDDVWVDVLFDYQKVIRDAEKLGINYVRLYAKRFKPARVIHGWGEHQLIRYETDPYGTQAYLINKPGAQRFLESVKTITMPIDDELSRFWVNGLDTYAVYPFPVIEKSARSNLSGERARRKADLKFGIIGHTWFRISEKIAKTLANLSFLIRLNAIRRRL